MVEILIGVVIGLLGIFIGIFLFQNAIFISKLESFEKELKSLRQETVVPSGLTFLYALAKQAKFWEKIFIQTEDKLLISNAIVTKLIRVSDKEVIVDSGTTISQIPYMLGQRNVGVKVYTNNLLAAVTAVPPPPEFNCFLLPGRIDPTYGATYKVEDIGGPLKGISADKIVLSATAVSFEKGPMVDQNDVFNCTFKKELIQKALDDPFNHGLIIAVDWTKFSIRTENGFIPVLDQIKWLQVKAQSCFVLVTTAPKNSIQTAEASRARKEISLFKQNMSRGGMKIEICSSR